MLCMAVNVNQMHSYLLNFKLVIFIFQRIKHNLVGKRRHSHPARFCGSVPRETNDDGRDRMFYEPLPYMERCKSSNQGLVIPYQNIFCS